MVHACIIALGLSVGVAPPLTGAQQAELQQAVDGSDHREQAFLALVQNIRAWPADASPADRGEPVHLTLDESSLIARPADLRGEVFRIHGALLQQTRLPPPFEDVFECFVRRHASAQPVIVYIVAPSGELPINDRANLQFDGRFYKSVRFVARDGISRDYPAFVTRYPGAVRVDASATPTPAAPPASERMLMLGAVVAALLVAFVIVRMIVSRHQRTRAAGAPRVRGTGAAPEAVDEVSDLPDDPADALAELRRRAGR